MPGDFNTAPQDMTPEMIKCLPDYRKSKIDLVKRLFTLQGAYEDKCLKEQELNGLVANLTKELEDKSFVNACATPLDHAPQQQELMIILDPPDNQELEEDNSEFSVFQQEKEHMSNMLLELKHEVESCNKIINELEQEKEEIFVELEKLKEASSIAKLQSIETAKENGELKQKLNFIEGVMKNMKTLLTLEF